MKRLFLWLTVACLLAIAHGVMAQVSTSAAAVHLITLDPGHFHAALVQKFMYPQVDPQVHVYAPAGDDLDQHLKRIELFGARTEQPTRWHEIVHTGADFFEQMLAEKPGNVVVLAGNNARKTDYILKSLQAGLNVLADKPMAVTPEGFQKLKQAFAIAAEQKLLLYDIMTERFEITTILQRALSQQQELFGELVTGTPDEPAITKEGVHHFSKVVADVPLRRPQWFFDVRQEGEGIVDVTTHLVDLIQWEAFPERALNPEDVTMLKARRWTTALTREQFQKVTGADSFPAFLTNDVKDGELHVSSNGEFTYRLRGIHAKVSVIWNFEAPPGAGDTHYSMMRGTKARLIIRQGADQGFKPTLYVENAGKVDAESFERNLSQAIASLQDSYPGISFEREKAGWRITIPERYHNGHEAHFGQVTENFLRYLEAGRLPDWEVPNMITKYATLMKAYEMSR